MTRKITLDYYKNRIYHSSLQPEKVQYTYKTQDPNMLLMQPDIKEIFMPLNILRNHSSLEAIVVYLKDKKGLRFCDIARLLNRDQRTIWVTYNNALTKKIIIEDEKTEFYFPISIIASRNLSVLEGIVFYLKTTLGISFNDISEMLGKNYRTIWTVYKRSVKKVDVTKEHE